MAQRGPALFTVTPRSMSRLAIIFLVLAAFFGLLNSYKVKALRANVASTQATSDASPGHGQVAAKSEDAQQRTAQGKEVPKESRKKRDTAPTQRESVTSHHAGVHGSVLAYNQAYNFVVLNLGARNGVEPNSEMLVLRDGTLIAKIRISSVEPATAIGDIITNSLARGVQVQPGDNVIYAGTSP